MNVLRLTTPAAGAVIRSLLGVLAMTAVSLYLISPAAAMWTAGAGIVAAAVALQDVPGRRWPIVVIASAELGAAVLLGGLTGAHDIAFVVAVAGWGFLAGMQWALGAHAAFVSVAAGAMLVIAPPVATGWVDLLAGTAMAVTAGLLQAALVWLRPPQRWRVQQHALTRAHRSLAEDARSMAAARGTALDPAQITWLREVFLDIPVSQRPKAYQVGYRLPERISATLTALRRTDTDCSELLSAAGDFLDAIAGHGVTAHRDAERAMHRVDEAVAAIDGPGADAAQQFSQQLHDAAVLRFGQLRGPDLAGSLSDAAASMRRHLDWTSPVLRHAIRLAAAVAIGAGVARFGGLHEGFWIALSVLLALRPETSHTYTRSAGRLAGTAAGIALASALSLLWPPSGMVAAVGAVVFAGLAYLVWEFGDIAVSAAIAAAAVFVVGIDAPVQALAVTDRLLALVIGGGLVLVAHVVLPDDELIRLRQRAGELLKTEIDYAATVARAFVHQIDHPAGALATAWQRAMRARAAFEAASGAVRLDEPELRQWLRSLRSALNAITGACTTMEAGLPQLPPSGLRPEFVAAVDDYIDALRGAPPHPAAPWTVNLTELTAADQLVRRIAPGDSAAARVLVTGLGTITRSLAGITVLPAPTWAG
ncbi:FUSC family protein [Mycobacterium sp. WMMD1722]|uniref:FUSC family protein n=1 Tax=Mycobacterium sp. WMMD1722 TaxID=3404117 RepID=UPI003BF50FF9